jgi:hypothetical protein
MNCIAGQRAMIIHRGSATGEVQKCLDTFRGCIVKVVRLWEGSVWEFETPIAASFLLANGTTQRVDLIGIEDEYLMPLTEEVDA